MNTALAPAQVDLDLEHPLEVVPDQKTMNEKVIDLAALVAQAPQIDLRTTHMLCNEIYARTVFMPAGTIAIGCIHKSDHIIMQVCGDTTITTDEGVTRLTGWHMFPVKAGAKRALYMHEDTIWVGFHHTTKKTVAEIEADLCAEPENLQVHDVDYAAPLLSFGE